MHIAEFIRFYNYTIEQALNEYAKTFYSLLNDMYRIQATETLNMVYANNATEELINKLQKQEAGISGIVKEVKIVRGENVN